VDRLNKLAAKIRAEGGLVVFVQHEGPPGDAHHPSQPGFQLLADLQCEADDVRVLKSSCDAFLDTRLDKVLVDGLIGDVVITGCATDFCVDTTVRSALARGYTTTAPCDGHTTADRSYLPARQIIEHHNAIWADFISPVGPARVCFCAEV
jgi:nicotinamidase-related amidase